MVELQVEGGDDLVGRMMVSVLCIEDVVLAEGGFVGDADRLTSSSISIEIKDFRSAILIGGLGIVVGELD